MAKQNKGAKQSNKHFKGESKRRTKQKAAAVLKKTIKKQEHIRQPIEKQQPIEAPKPFEQLQQRTQKPRIVAVIPMNASSSPLKMRQQILNHLKIQSPLVTSYCTQEMFLTVPADKINKQPIQFIFLERNMEQILDACKVADFICPLLSCSQTDMHEMALNPQLAHAFDGFGYKVLSNIRAQCELPSICVIQDLELIPNHKRSQVKKLFTRYFDSEFKNAHIIEGAGTLLRTISGQNIIQHEWRDCRGYLLAEDVCQVNDVVSITGIWRGSTLNANQLVHITGLDDFMIDKIELIANMESETYFRDENGESMDPISRNQNHEIGDDFLRDIENINIEEPEEEQEIEMDDAEDNLSYDEGLNAEDLALEKKRRQEYEIEQRAPEDRDYEDEVEYGVEEILRDRYKKYQGLKNMRSAQFDPLTFLPEEADKIFNLRFLKKIKQDVIEESLKQKYFPAGLRVKIYLRGPIDVAKLSTPGKIIIVSGLLKHERKMTQMHVKIHRHQSFEGPLKNKSNINIQIGFRRAIVNPIYSRIMTNTNKTKLVKEVNDDGFYLASFYFLTTFPPQNVLIWNNEFDLRSGELMASGEVYKCDSFQIILKRVILTGYPYKINKRKAVIRLMFFNPEDVRYFMPIEISTKLGLRGNILEALGTHGLFKCMFNNYIKPNDTISLHLYKRVHPRFPKIM